MFAPLLGTVLLVHTSTPIKGIVTHELAKLGIQTVHQSAFEDRKAELSKLGWVEEDRLEQRGVVDLGAPGWGSCVRLGSRGSVPRADGHLPALVLQNRGQPNAPRRAHFPTPPLQKRGLLRRDYESFLPFVPQDLDYEWKKVFIRRVCTHAEYSKIKDVTIL